MLQQLYKLGKGGSTFNDHLSAAITKPFLAIENGIPKETTLTYLQSLEYVTGADGFCMYWAFLQTVSRKIVTFFVLNNPELPVVKRYNSSIAMDTGNIQSHERNWGGLESMDVLAFIFQVNVVIWQRLSLQSK
eukprot:3796085-Rhodomonas_salina.1